MWTTFWYSNAHFALEFFGGVAFFVAAWLFFDTFLMSRDIKTFLRSLGFVFLAVFGMVHAADVSSELLIWGSYVSYLAGLTFLAVSLVLDRPLQAPAISVVLVLPSAAGAAVPVGAAAAGLLAMITAVAFKRYRQESAKSLGGFLVAFLLLTLASGTALYQEAQAFGLVWIAEHALKAGAFAALAVWVWQYMRFRVKEELLLVFVAMALGIAILVTFTFSALLLGKMESDSKGSLATSVRVLDYAVASLKNEALTQARFIAGDHHVREAVEENDQLELQHQITGMKDRTGVDFITVADAKGDIILRSHAPTQVGDSIKSESAASRSLKGTSVAGVESTPTEEFSIRGAAPVLVHGEVVGVVVAGKIIDQSLVDEVRRVTGLNVTVFENATVVATTSSGEGAARTGTKLTEERVIERVLQGGKGYVGRAEMANRPILAAYVPLANGDGQVVGMLSVGKPQVEVLNAAESTNKLTLMVTIVLMLITILPAYLVARSISEQV